MISRSMFSSDAEFLEACDYAVDEAMYSSIPYADDKEEDYD